mmetsp:Transcript_135324/g.234633  ORF Transcript_135324/g.234633 Transcript_135324/m.234633 type:complete len:361 (+) Transcript_135324:2686-3768(+)
MELHFILKLLGTCAPAKEAFHLADCLHLFLLLCSQFHGVLLQKLTVSSVGKTPLNICNWGFIQVLLNVVKRVLGYICDTHIVMFPDLSAVRVGITDQHFDEGGLASSIGSQDGHTAAQGQGARAIGQLRLRGSRIRKGAMIHLQDLLRLGFDAVQSARYGKNKVQRVSFKCVVGLGLGPLLYESCQIARILDQLLALIVHDVSAHIVTERGTVGHNQARHVVQTNQILGQPRNGVHIQMIGWLVQQQHVRVHKHCPGKSQLHPPTSRQSKNRLSLEFFVKANLSEHFVQFINGAVLELWGMGQVLLTTHITVHVNIGLHINSLQVFRKSLHGFASNVPHQSGLTNTILPNKTITMAALNM